MDRSPAEVVATLLDEEVYLCSERTMYRVLASEVPVQERRAQRTHPEYKKPELMATAPNQVYGRVIGEMADTVGVSKSAVSRETVEASERVLKELMERRLDAWDLLVIYLDPSSWTGAVVLKAVCSISSPPVPAFK